MVKFLRALRGGFPGTVRLRFTVGMIFVLLVQVVVLLGNGFLTKDIAIL